jgi:DNA-binding beta-propeller fold protein YncE
MRKLLSISLGGAMLITAVTAAPAAGWAASPIYRLAETIPLGGGIKWDYLHFDPATGRLFISHGTELTVVDPAEGKVIGQVGGLQGSHGIAIDPVSGLGYADSAKTETIVIFNVKSLQTAKTIPALPDADGMIFDPASNQVFIAGGDAKAVLAVNAMTETPAATIPLGGAPEFLVTDGNGNLYVNINDKNEIVRISTKTNTITARWALPGCNRPAGLAIDTKSQRLFSSCENEKLAVVDARSGTIVALLPIGKGTDAASFDAVRNLVLSSNRDGTLTIIKEVDPGHFVPLTPLHTAPGARTMAIAPASGDLFLVTADVSSAGQPKHAGGPPNYQFKPGTLKLLVYRPRPDGP